MIPAGDAEKAPMVFSLFRKNETSSMYYKHKRRARKCAFLNSLRTQTFRDVMTAREVSLQTRWQPSIKIRFGQMGKLHQPLCWKRIQFLTSN